MDQRFVNEVRDCQSKCKGNQFQFHLDLFLDISKFLEIYPSSGKSVQPPGTPTPNQVPLFSCTLFLSFSLSLHGLLPLHSPLLHSLSIHCFPLSHLFPLIPHILFLVCIYACHTGRHRSFPPHTELSLFLLSYIGS